MAVLGVLLAGVELAFGNWLRPSPMNQLNLMRGVARTYAVGDLYDSEAPRTAYTRDRFGFRGAYPTPSAIDILTLGGSATDQRYIADGETWQDVLADAFRAGGTPMSVVNAGIDGQTTYGHIKDFEWWFPFVPDLRVRYVLFYIGVNDLHRAEAGERDELVSPSSVRGAFEANSALYRLYRTIKGALRARMSEGVSHRRVDFSALAWTRDPTIQDHDGALRNRRAAYSGRLRALAAKAREMRAVPIFVTQPSRRYRRVDGEVLGTVKGPSIDGRRINGVDYYRFLRLLHQTTLEVCAEARGIPVDLEAEVDWEDDDFYDYSHNTPKGARKIGEHLHARLSGRLGSDPLAIRPPGPASARRQE